MSSQHRNGAGVPEDVQLIKGGYFDSEFRKPNNKSDTLIGSETMHFAHLPVKD
jgi:hypothetical protein